MSRLIDADELKAVYIPSEIEGFEKMMVPVEVVLQNIDDMPTVDAVEVVRCRDCRYWKKDHALDGYTLYEGHMVCTYAIAHSFVRHPEDFCSKGERKDGDNHDGS